MTPIKPHKPGTPVRVMHRGRWRLGTIVKPPGYTPPTGCQVVLWDEGEAPDAKEQRSVLSTSKLDVYR